MRTKRGVFQILRVIPVLIAVCLAGFPGRAISAAAGASLGPARTSRYIFLSDQSELVQTGGIAGIHRTYAIEGHFLLTVDPNAGTASFSQVDANATDDSPFRHSLDPNEVFNMGGLDGTIPDDGYILFEGKAEDQSSIRIWLMFEDGRVDLVGRTTPPPGSADFFAFTLDAVAQRKYAGGSGTAQDPYQIATAADLIALGETPGDYGKCFILTAGIDLDPRLPGRKVFDKAIIVRFTGVFDGNGHTISHLTIKGGGYLGLFGELRIGAEVRDLGIADANITASNDYTGVLVGTNGGALTGCYSTGVVRGREDVGGLVGDNWGTVAQCYSACAVSGGNGVGGLMGENSNGTVNNCYSTGPVRGTGQDGGLMGYNGGAVVHCFWDTHTSGQAKSAGGTGKTTAEMQTAKTFLDAGWDFMGETANGTEDIWWINEGKGYPKLSWQLPAGMILVDIPAGTFQMGDHDGVGWEEERPVHTVTLDGFQMSKYETTNAQYAAYLNTAMAAGQIQVVDGVVYASSDSSRSQPHCDTRGSSSYSQIEYSEGRFTVLSRDSKAMADHPVVRVSWYGANAFCDYYGYRLPTEAEWEYAARGGYHDPYYKYPWGSNVIDCSKANYYNGSSFCNPLGLTSYPYTSPVGHYGPQGAYGLCDMSGNVWEWCQDWYDPAYYSSSPGSSPTGPASGTSRVLRGGCWECLDYYCRVAFRYGYSPSDRSNHLGFRVCR